MDPVAPWLASGRRVIVNPTSGEHIVIRTSGAETGGRELVFDLFLPPGTHVPATHVHPLQTEQFAVVAGRMRFNMAGRTILAGPGETVVVPPRTVHWFGNAGSEVAHAVVKVRPALRMEELLEASEAMGPPKRILGLKLTPATAFAAFMLEFRREIAVPHVPAFLVNALLAPLARLARRRAARSAA